MFSILFIITIIVFFSIKTIDSGIATMRYIGDIYNDPIVVSNLVYTIIIFMIVIFGILTFFEIKKFNTKNIKRNYLEKRYSEGNLYSFGENGNLERELRQLDTLINEGKISKMEYAMIKKIITKKH